jgi:hypothetical protein
MPYCSYCGNLISDAATACPKCGNATSTAQATTGRVRVEPMSIVSLVLGIAGLLSAFIPLVGLVPPILAVGLGTSSLKTIESDRTLEGRSMASTGRVLGWVGIGLSALWLTIVVVA